MAEQNGMTVVIDTMPAGTAVDGWDLTSGTQGDAAYGGSGSASKIAILKGIYARLAAGSGGGAVTVADGSDVTQGAKADTAATGTGITTASFSAIALLKGIYNAVVGATPAGANIIGKFGIDQTTAGTTNGVVVNSGALTATVDGADPASPTVTNQGTGSRGWLATIAALLRLGTANSASSASVVMATDMSNLEPGGTPTTAAGSLGAGGKGLTGWLSTIAYNLTQVLGIKAAAAAFADGALTTLGSTTDAVQSGATSATGVSAMSIFKGLFNLIQSGAARFNLVAAIVYQGTTGASLAASTAVGLPTMQCGTSAGSIYFATINASVMSPPSAGQIKPQGSNDGTNWFDTGALVSCPASTVTTASAKVFAQYARWVYVNGTTALSSAVSIYTSAQAT